MKKGSAPFISGTRLIVLIICVCAMVSTACTQKTGESEGFHAAVCSEITKEKEEPGGFTKRRISYTCEVEKCPVYVEVLFRADDSAYIDTNSKIYKECSVLPYGTELAVWERLISAAKKDGVLTNVTSAGPGIGGEMCAGDLRKRQIITVLRLLSEKKLKNAGLSEAERNVELIWSEADIFREYEEMFAKFGYRLKMAEYEGAEFEKVNRDEILKYDPASKLDSLYISCGAFDIYFDVK